MFRPYIMFVVFLYAHFQFDPLQVHLIVVKNDLFYYLIGITNLGLCSNIEKNSIY